jgi:hypothetical protein
VTFLTELKTTLEKSDAADMATEFATAAAQVCLLLKISYSIGVFYCQSPTQLVSFIVNLLLNWCLLFSYSHLFSYSMSYAHMLICHMLLICSYAPMLLCTNAITHTISLYAVFDLSQWQEGRLSRHIQAGSDGARLRQGSVHLEVGRIHGPTPSISAYDIRHTPIKPTYSILKHSMSVYDTHLHLI